MQPLFRFAFGAAVEAAALVELLCLVVRQAGEVAVEGLEGLLFFLPPAFLAG